MGEKEDWSLVRVLTKLVRDCSLLGYYTLVPKPGRPCQAKPSAAPRHCVPRKHPDDSEKKERSEERRGWNGMDLSGLGGKKEEGFESKSSE